eukprot:6719-Heterococcus_DN1.PRE.6
MQALHICERYYVINSSLSSEHSSHYLALGHTVGAAVQRNTPQWHPFCQLASAVVTAAVTATALRRRPQPCCTE